MSTLSNKALVRGYAFALAFWVLTVSAGQNSGVFNVNISLQPANAPSAPKTGFCTRDPGSLGFGATSTIVCSAEAVVDVTPGKTGVPFSVLQLSRGVDLPHTIDIYAGAGNVASGRLVNVAGYVYMEILVGW